MTTATNAPRALILDNRDFVRVDGPEAEDFLNRLVTNDVSRATQEQAAYAALLTPQGKYLFDFFIHRTGTGFLLDLDKGGAPELVKRLSIYRLRAKVELGDVSDLWRTIAIDFADPHLSIKVAVSSPDPRHQALGQRWIVPAHEAQATADQFAAWPQADYRQRMLDNLVPDHGRDLVVDKTFLMDVNFDGLNGVDFKKGCYIGQELTARMKHRATSRRGLVRVVFDRGPIPVPGTPILSGVREIGQLASGQGTCALAIMRMDKLAELDGEPLTADGIGITITSPI